MPAAPFVVKSIQKTTKLVQILLIFSAFSLVILVSTSRQTRLHSASCFLVPRKAGQVSAKWSGRSGLRGAPLGERGAFKDGHHAAEYQPLDSY